MAPEEIVDGMSVDLSGTPAEFVPLLPYLRKWAIGDDQVRTEVEEAASTEELQAMHDAVWPHMDAINAYLDATMDMTPCPDDAMLLLQLGQCVSEVHFVLERRRKQR